MRPKLSVLIVDKEKKHRDYDLSTADIVGIGENTVDVNVIENLDNLNSDLNKYKGYDCIISIGDVNTLPLTNSSFEVRKKWVHYKEYDKKAIANALISTFMYNINRDRGDEKLISIFTCTFRTQKSVITRLYDSLVEQTYHNWNW